MSAVKDVNGFVMYSTDRASLALLSDSDRGQLLMALFDYWDGVDTSAALTPQAQMAFAFLSARMSHDLDRYRRRCEVNRENAVKRWSVRESAPDARDDEGG